MKRRKENRNVAGLVVCVLALTAAGGCGAKAPESPSETGRTTLSVGMELAYPPFEMTDEQNQPAGVSVDLARALAEWMDRDIVIENIPFDGLIPALRTGKIDCVISSMTATPERAKAVDFSEPYLETGLCLLVGADAAVETIADLDQAGRTVAVKKGTTGHQYAVQRLTKAEVLLFDKETAAVLEVTQGKADAFIYDQMSTFKNWRKHPETTRAILTPFTREGWAVAVGKGNPALLDQINAFLKAFRSEGRFEALGDKHLKEMKQSFEALNYEFFF